MSKRLFISLVILMSLSLIGIIFVQGYWIQTAIENKEEQFSMNINQMLKTVSERISQREVTDFVTKVNSLRDSLGKEPEDTELTEVFVKETNKNANETFIYAHGLLEEDYNVSAKFFENVLGDDTTYVKNYVSTRRKQVIRERFDMDGNLMAPEVVITEDMGNLDRIDKAYYETSYIDIAKRIPIHKRVSREEIAFGISQELLDRDIDIDFEFGVYSKGLATKVKSRNYRAEKTLKRYSAPLFMDNEGTSDYTLNVIFPNKRKFLITSIIGMSMMSIVFTLIIIVAYSSALYQLIRQKQISEIKTDFMNNMTHEFKTPIATINLALDAIGNPKVLSDEERVKRYLGMIREENKRMHAQVENVLRISKLEKNQLDISKDKVDVHDLIEDAVSHVSLIVQNRGGLINTHKDAAQSEILGSQVHLTNVLVNMLDNAMKYSEAPPKVDVFTENVKNSIIIKVQDQGVGMSKAVLRRVFEKFYREHTGDVHNVKGHGLGLAYVKRIAEDHQGEVYAESEKDKGSTFYIKLPLI